MVLRQRVSARMPLAAWIGLAAIGLLVLPGFSTAQVEPKKEGEATEVRTTISDKPAIAAQPTVVPTNSDRPTVEVQAVTAKPAIATEPAVDPEQRAPQLSPRPIVEAGVRPPAPAETVKASDEHLLQKVAPNRRAVRLARSRGTKLTSKEVEYISDVLMPLIERMRSQGTLRSSGWTDKYIVNEVFLHMLERMPTEPENKAWVDHVKRHGDGGIKDLVAALGQSSEFTGPEKPTAARTAAELNPLPPSKQAKVQTLLRVVYDMPADKAKALAAFLKENVHQQQLEVHVDEQAGLVVTAEGEFQAPIAAMVSLMTGERVTLDLSAGRATGYATYPSLPHSTPPKQPPHYATIPTPSTSYGPPMTAAGPRTGIFPPDDGKAAKTLDQPSDAGARKPEQAPDSTTKEGSGSPLGSIRP